MANENKFTFICPHCGAEIIANNKEETVKCKHCRSQYLIDDVKTNIVNVKRHRSEIEEAIRLRNHCDFDEASTLLESLILQEKNNPELYYQLLLCDYGISFVLDNDEISEKPILNRLQREVVFDKPYYKKLEELLIDKPDTLKRYHDTLEYIEMVRAKAIAIANKEKPYDVFICYKKTSKDSSGRDMYTEDSQTARRLYNLLTKWNLKVFFADETLAEVANGLEYEPIIYSALMSAKALFVVCASPNNPEFITSPWVKSEWQRFLKRCETEQEKLLICPVLDKGFTVDLLPTQLKKRQFLYFDNEFNEKCKNSLSSVLVREKRGFFKNVVVESEVSKLNIKKEDIKFGSFSTLKEQELDNLESADLEIAKGEMKSHTTKGFTRAVTKLNRIIENNPNNYQANLAKFKCYFSIDYDQPITDGILTRKIDYTKFNEDFLATLAVAGPQMDNLREEFIDMLIKTMSKSLVTFLDIVSKDNDPLNMILSTYTNIDDMYNAASLFESTFIESLRSYDGSFNKDLNEKIDTFIAKIFRRIYSNYDKIGAKALRDLYYKIALFYDRKKQNKIAGEYIDKALEIDESDARLLWSNFVLNVCHTLKVEDKEIAKSFNNKNFVSFPIDKLPSYETQKGNLYYFIIRYLQSGSHIDFTTSYFRHILNISKYLLNDKKKEAIGKDILNFLSTILDSGHLSKEGKENYFLEVGNRLLIEEEYEEARKYFEQILIFNAESDEARWGLVKCDIHCPTNFSLIFYKGKTDLGDIKSFRTLVKGSSNGQKYIDYRTILERVKENYPKEERKRVLDYFSLHEKMLLDAPDPLDWSIEHIMNDFKLKIPNRFQSKVENKAYQAIKNHPDYEKTISDIFGSNAITTLAVVANTLSVTGNSKQHNISSINITIHNRMIIQTILAVFFIGTSIGALFIPKFWISFLVLFGSFLLSLIFLRGFDLNDEQTPRPFKYIYHSLMFLGNLFSGFVGLLYFYGDAHKFKFYEPSKMFSSGYFYFIVIAIVVNILWAFAETKKGERNSKYLTVITILSPVFIRSIYYYFYCDTIQTVLPVILYILYAFVLYSIAIGFAEGTTLVSIITKKSEKASSSKKEKVLKIFKKPGLGYLILGIILLPTGIIGLSIMIYGGYRLKKGY